MSHGDAIKVDEDEVREVMMGIDGKHPIIVKQGLINPSFVVSVVVDKDRVEKTYGDGSVSGLATLENVFDNVKKLAESVV